MEVIAINGTIQRLPVLYVPSDAIEGRYRFRATIFYQGTEISGEGSFRVRIGEERPTEEVAPEILTDETECSICVAGIPTEVSFKGVVGTSGIEEIEVTTTRTVWDVCIRVETIATDLQYSYRYIRITTEKLQDWDISDARIRFRVEKEWLRDNNYDKNAISLHRFNGDNGWEKLPTSLLSENLEYITYEAISPGFSLFAITAVPEDMKIAMIDYPEGMNITQGGTLLFSVIVENTGELPLENVIVSLRGVLLDTEVFPSAVDILDIDSGQIFIIEVKAHEELTPGEYRLTLMAVSDYVAVKKEIVLFVMEKPDLPEEIERARLKAEIENIRGVIDRVWDETVESGLGGKNVSGAFGLLKESKDSVDLATGYLEGKNYDKAREFIERSRNSLEESVVLLAKVNVTEKLVEVPRVEYALSETYRILLIIVVLMVLVLILERHRLKKSFSGVEEKFELDRLRAIFGRHRVGEVTHKPEMKEMARYKQVDDMKDIDIIKKRIGYK